MNESNSSNMLFGALVARNEAPQARAVALAPPRMSRATLAWAGAALLTIVVFIAAV